MKRCYTLLLALITILSLTGCAQPPQPAAVPTTAVPTTTAPTTTDPAAEMPTAGTDTSVMEVHFIDVGQGDATLIRSGEHYMLIDAGDESKGTLVQNYLQKRGVEKLDYLVLTHPDADHIGGAPVVVTKFPIDTVWMSDYTKDNKLWDKLMQSLKYRNLTYTTSEVGSTYHLGSAEITILGPNRSYDNPNDASIALMIRNGDNRFLFTGDATEPAERDIMDTGISLQADVYKAGHHGSKTSSHEEFVAAISPDSTVISCAEDNSYGHPHAQTLNTFRFNGIQVYRTDESGSIMATSDGTTIRFDVPASDTWQAGEPKGSSASNPAPTAETSSAAASEPSSASESSQMTVSETSIAAPEAELTYVLNSKTLKFHLPTCRSLPTTNRVDSNKSREALIGEGYSACGICKP